MPAVAATGDDRSPSRSGTGEGLWCHAVGRDDRDRVVAGGCRCGRAREQPRRRQYHPAGSVPVSGQVSVAPPGEPAAVTVKVLVTSTVKVVDATGVMAGAWPTVSVIVTFDVPAVSWSPQGRRRAARRPCTGTRRWCRPCVRAGRCGDGRHRRGGDTARERPHRGDEGGRHRQLRQPPTRDGTSHHDPSALGNGSGHEVAGGSTGAIANPDPERRSCRQCPSCRLGRAHGRAPCDGNAPRTSGVASRGRCSGSGVPASP